MAGLGRVGKPRDRCEKVLGIGWDGHGNPVRRPELTLAVLVGRVKLPSSATNPTMLCPRALVALALASGYFRIAFAQDTTAEPAAPASTAASASTTASSSVDNLAPACANGRRMFAQAQVVTAATSPSSSPTPHLPFNTSKVMIWSQTERGSRLCAVLPSSTYTVSWSYTDLVVTPASLTLAAFCSANQHTYPVGTVPGAVRFLPVHPKRVLKPSGTGHLV
jgi:hypothetical protein